MKFEKIESDGYLLPETNDKINNVAFISLKSALKSFFNTYQSLYGISFLENEETTIKEKDTYYTIAYIENVNEAITSFHHFVELILKDILSQKHPLLAIDASRKHEILHDLIFNISVESNQIQSLKHLEFSEALTRIVSLIETDRINATKYDFIMKAKPWLQKLNIIRNRIMHRGIFVLRYEAMDWLFGKYALSFINNILSLPEYKTSSLWKFKPIDCEIDIFKEIEKSFSISKYNMYRVALLKQLGRAAYENPIVFPKSMRSKFEIDDELIKRSQNLAAYVLKAEFCRDIKRCPVCGLETLVLFTDSFEEYDQKTKEVIGSYEYPYKVKCFCCSFELNDEIRLEKVNLPIENYFKI